MSIIKERGLNLPAMYIHTIEQLHDLRETILRNLTKTYASTGDLFAHEDVLSAFASLRFRHTAFDPICGTPLNFIETLNQTFSDLIVLYGTEELLHRYPEHTFTIRLGAQSGYDIESEDGSIVGECFAVTKMNSNNKLKKDTEKLLSLEENIQKYIFFYSESDEDAKIQSFTRLHPKITYVRIREFVASE